MSEANKIHASSKCVQHAQSTFNMYYGLTHYKVFLMSLVPASLLKLESYGEKLKTAKRKEATKGTKQKN